jgi:hypothetical protein
MSVLSVHNLIYGYSKGTPFETGALKGVSLDFEQGEIEVYVVIITSIKLNKSIDFFEKTC